jgi:hypothetical protein
MSVQTMNLVAVPIEPDVAFSMPSLELPEIHEDFATVETA